MHQVITYLLYGVAFLVAAVLVLAVVGLVVAVVVSIARSFFVRRHAESDGPGPGAPVQFPIRTVQPGCSAT